MTRFADFVLVAQDDTGDVVACAYSVPFVLEGGGLPDSDWDLVIRNGLLASLHGQQPDAISAVEIGPPRPQPPSAIRCALGTMPGDASHTGCTMR